MQLNKIVITLLLIIIVHIIKLEISSSMDSNTLSMYNCVLYEY